MKPHAALVGADGAVHLDAIALVELDRTRVVDPGNAEEEHTLRLGHTLEDLGRAVLRVSLDHGLERLHDLHDGLMKLRLAGVLGREFGHEFVNEFAHVVPSTWRYGLDEVNARHGGCGVRRPCRRGASAL